MKKIVLFIFSIIIVSSCNKEVLDKKPLSDIADETLWKDQKLMNAYLTSAYMNTYVFDNESNHHMSTSGEHFSIFMVNSVTDESFSTHTWAGNANKFKNGGLKIEGGLLEWWESAYLVIRTLNELIQNVPSSPADSDFKTSCVAEARFLRAFNYFSMVKRYGGVPLITTPQKPTDPVDSLFPKRNTEQSIYDFVISECDAIVNDLPETRTATDYGRPTRYGVMALKCRAALYAASIAQYGTIQLEGILGIDASKKDYYYQLSYDAAEQIISSHKFSLYNKYTDKVKNFRQLFLDESGNAEKIFVKPHDNINPDKEGNGWTYDFMQCPTPNSWAQGNNDGPYLETAEAFEYVDGTPGTLNRTAIQTGVWTTDALWANKDPRFYATIYTMNTSWQGIKLDCHNGIVKPDGTTTTSAYGGVLGKGVNVFKTGFGVLKYLDESHDNMGDFATSQQDWTLFRYGEILLNYAEAAFELGIGDPLDAVNQIRSRAGIALLTSINRDRIRQERKVELAFEGHRYWDLRRWRIAESVLSINRTGLQYLYDYNTGSVRLKLINKMDGTTSTPAFYPRNYYLPITLKRTADDPNLVENPGY